MRKWTLAALLAGIALLLGSAVVAAEQKVGLEEQTAVAVTIYNDNLAIVTNPRGQIVFSGVPAGLRPRPTLVLDVDSGKASTAPVELSYLTGGLDWRADYVAKLVADESTIDLNGLVTLTNTSGTTYRDAKLQLVAGEVNQVIFGRPGEALGGMADDYVVLTYRVRNRI